MCQSQGTTTMVKIRDFFDPFPEAKILKSNKLLGQYLAEKYGADCHLFNSHVKAFKAKYYGKYKRNKKSFLSCESNWLDKEVPFARAVRQPTKSAAKKARKAFSEVGPKQQKRRTEEFLRNVEPGQLEAAARIAFKDAFDNLENGFNAVDAKSPKEESLAQLVIRRRDDGGRGGFNNGSGGGSGRGVFNDDSGNGAASVTTAFAGRLACEQ